MRLMRLVLINIKRQLKNPMMLIMTVAFPVVMLIFINKGAGAEVGGEIGIVDNCQSQYSNELISRLEEDYGISQFVGEQYEQEGFNLLRENKLGAIYVIDSDFDKKINNGDVPTIKCFKTESQSGSIVADNIITTFISNILQEDISEGLSSRAVSVVINENNEINKENYKMTVVMICYFMMIGSSIIVGEIINLKNQKVLRRTISTSNSDMMILGSLFLSSFIIQGLLSSFAFILLVFVLKLPIGSLAQGVLIIFLSSLITTAIVAAITRWVKNITLASLSVVILGVITLGLGLFSTEINTFENIPIVISRLGVISPFTWLVRIIDNGELVIPILVITLMSAVFFTAGSFRLREFVKE